MKNTPQGFQCQVKKDPEFHRKIYRKRQRILEWWRNRKKSPWASEYDWKPLLEHDYSCWFDSNCIEYAHYLGAVMGTNDFLFTDVVDKARVSKCVDCFTSLEDDRAIPNNKMEVLSC